MTWHDLLLAGGPIVGALAGGWLTRTSNNQHWRRDRCLETYADIVQISGIVVAEADRLYLGTADDEDRQRSLLQDKHLELGGALARATLLCLRDMDPLCLAVSECFMRIVKTAEEHPKMPREEWTRLMTVEAGAVVGRFLAAARSDVATSSLLDRIAGGISWVKQRFGITAAR